MTQSKC